MTEVVEIGFDGALAERLAFRPEPGTRLYWLGQAGFVLETHGYRLIIDPYLSDSLGEKYRGKAFPHERMMGAPVTPAALGRVDLVLSTHHHTDHMDAETLRPLFAARPDLRLVAPAAARAEALQRTGVCAERLILLDAGERIRPLAGLFMTATRAAHETLERDDAGRHRFLGYVIEADGIRIWHSGDCVPFQGLIEEVAALKPDLALLPVNGRSGALSSKGIAGNFSLSEAIETARAVGAPTLIAHHYGMFAFNTIAPEAIDRAAADTNTPRILRARTNATYSLASLSMDALMNSDQPSRARETTPNILEVVRTLQPTLRKSDRKVADLVLADPRRVLDATVAEAAELAGVSQPTVIRFSVAVGCSGYQEFRFRLAQSLALGTPATHSVLSTSDAPEAVIEKIFDYTMTSLDWARHHLDHAAVARAVELLEKATNIEFFGFGASGIVARDAQQKFPLFGVPCGAQVDSHQQIMAASMMQPGQVAVVISNTGLTRSIIEVARTARGNGASVIGITGSASLVIEHCDVALIVETLDNTNVYTPTISRIAALVVIDVLSTAVALRRDSAQGDRFQAMKRQLAELRVAQRL